MKYMSHNDIRNTWFRFFKEKGHKLFESAPLVPINDDSLLSVNKNELGSVLLNASNYRVVIIDLNDADSGVCDEVLYLVEPSILKLNKVLRLDNKIFNKLMGYKIVLNKTLVSGGNIDTFEYETGVKVFDVIKPLDDRSSKPMLEGILSKLGFIDKKEEDVK